MVKVRCPPPARFLPAGRVLNSWMASSEPPFLRTPRRRGSKAAGLRYERKALNTLEGIYPEFVRSPWFRFIASGSPKPRWCQPDGLLFDIPHGIIYLVEVKLKHTADAWWQVRHLYEPVVAACFGGEGKGAGPSPLWRIAAVQVVRWFDPDASFPEPFKVVPELKRARPEEFSVLVQREN